MTTIYDLGYPMSFLWVPQPVAFCAQQALLWWFIETTNIPATKFCTVANRNLARTVKAIAVWNLTEAILGRHISCYSCTIWTSVSTRDQIWIRYARWKDVDKVDCICEYSTWWHQYIYIYIYQFEILLTWLPRMITSNGVVFCICGYQHVCNNFHINTIKSQCMKIFLVYSRIL